MCIRDRLTSIADCKLQIADFTFSNQQSAISNSIEVSVNARSLSHIGIGPNISPAGVALAMAAGVTFRAGVLNIPMNFAVVPSKEGMRVSMLTGFTLRK